MNIKWALALPALALLAAFFLWWTQHDTNHQRILTLELDPNCHLHLQSCTSNYQQMSFTLDITPKPIPIAKQLNVNAQIQGVAPTQVQLDINGSNMYMGYNRITLRQQQDGSWTGKSLLAFCTTDAMQWQLTLLVDLPDGAQLQIPFPLTTPFSQQ
jgi:hypothetical protein